MVHELGVFQVWENGYYIPPEASWVVAARQTYVPPRPGINVILNYYNVHPRTEAPTFETAAELNKVEQDLMAIPTANFWGILFIREEHYRNIVNFNDDVDTTWFGERLLGYPLYLVETPGATVDDWKDEMYLRMIRGFYNYFSPLTKVGISAGGPSLYHPTYKEKSYLEYFGQPAMDFMQNYDFVFLLRYSVNLEDYKARMEPYFAVADQLFQNQKKFGIITRKWGHNLNTWEPEAIGPEMFNYLKRNCVVMTYEEHAAGGYFEPPTFSEMWLLMLRGRELYYIRAPYTENRVPDTNLLTGYIGDTYGFVADPEHDEGLYPTPVSPLELLIRAALSAATGVGLILLLL